MSLLNSTKGGIQLSFSKNRLGMRSGPAEEVISSRVSLNGGNRKSDGDSYIAVSTQGPIGVGTLGGGLCGHVVVALGPTFPTMGTGATNDYPPAYMYGR
ncbi:hypothetical protein BOTCAL_0951g00010 [Botryotinia calthae]|uniref:Uncharacterized protein n=1 Tax=Botryotinia calthae TaxID=38488 RepID=A0A4Y8CGC5_9HELO|nr:hypothetical protein BOTCAL_0951g00010 [Botryotinia calthae]